MRKRLIGLAAALLLAAQAASAAPGDSTIVVTPPEDGRIVITADSSGRVTAPVYINGDGPYEFIVDTGANRSAISSDLAQQLALPPVGVADVHALTGVFRAPLVLADRFRAGPLQVRALAMPVIEGGVLGEARGVLGVESLSGRRLIVDFRRRELVISEARDPLPEDEWRTVPGRLHFGQLVDTDGAVGRVPVRVIIDTGSSNSFANTALRDALRRYARANEGLISWRTLNVHAPIVSTSALYLPDLTIGGVRLRNLHVGVAEMYAFELWNARDEPTLVLGVDALRQTRAMAIDYARNSVHLLR